ncbi:hypothetical protein RJ641_035979 [Dillenia turbinata]|uniref:Uncharacterized protein n=1 Tax=Dillenia turbinata TaxID=194707 RepID=A0AAN8VF35_9MAGN
MRQSAIETRTGNGLPTLTVKTNPFILNKELNESNLPEPATKLRQKPSITAILLLECNNCNPFGDLFRRLAFHVLNRFEQERFFTEGRYYSSLYLSALQFVFIMPALELKINRNRNGLFNLVLSWLQTIVGYSTSAQIFSSSSDNKRQRVKWVCEGTPIFVGLICKKRISSLLHSHSEFSNGSHRLLFLLRPIIRPKTPQSPWQNLNLSKPTKQLT